MEEERPPTPIIIAGTTVSVTMRVRPLARDGSTAQSPVWSSIVERRHANHSGIPASESFGRAYSAMEARMHQQQRERMQQRRPSSTVPQLVASPQNGRRPPGIEEPMSTSVRTKASLRRLAHKLKKLFFFKKPAPTPEQAQCPCFHYPPEGWRFCRYDEHVAEGIRGIAAREIALG
ncbi:hypothetical protein DBV05_g9965 [Lasiodiplodia theobromae]|uniref:Uncharacterized protein n=1 Tax=Lasiodiplodia theobromae TaxID=45133 RepID=A0A5N5D1C2_9PEZI|nr:hypothetical protein DBV05_g9965 [Lasiodiplodia theobromae]